MFALASELTERRRACARSRLKNLSRARARDRVEQSLSRTIRDSALGASPSILPPRVSRLGGCSIRRNTHSRTTALTHSITRGDVCVCGVSWERHGARERLFFERRALSSWRVPISPPLFLFSSHTPRRAYLFGFVVDSERVLQQRVRAVVAGTWRKIVVPTPQNNINGSFCAGKAPMWSEENVSAGMARSGAGRLRKTRGENEEFGKISNILASARRRSMVRLLVRDLSASEEVTLACFERALDACSLLSADDRRSTKVQYFVPGRLSKRRGPLGGRLYVTCLERLETEAHTHTHTRVSLSHSLFVFLREKPGVGARVSRPRRVALLTRFYFARR